MRLVRVFFGIGIVVDSFLCLGAMPESKGCWNSLANTPPSWVEQSLSTLPLSLSGIAALLGFTLRSMEVTSCSLMVRAWRGELRITGLQVVGVLLLLKWVKKLLSCPAREVGSGQLTTAGLDALPTVIFKP